MFRFFAGLVIVLVWAASAAAQSSWQAVGVGDFNGDRHADVLWFNASSGALGAWLLDGQGNVMAMPFLSLTPAPSPPPTGGGGAPPAFAGEANSATDGSGAAFNRSSLSLNVSGTGSLLLVAWHAEYDGGLPDGWTVTANGTPGTLMVDTNGYTGGDGNRRFRIYYWLNPTPGPNTIVVANPYNGDNELAVSAILLTGVAQQGALGEIVGDVSTNDRTGESETVPTTTSDLVVHVIADATLVRGTLGPGETSLSVANDGNQKLNAGDGDASLWIASKPGTSPTTTVSSSGWPGGPSPSPRPLNGVAIVVHGGN